MSFCRITGKSRNLPKAQYFPILPPISPADAKKFTTVTRKNLDSYTNLYNIIKSPQGEVVLDNLLYLKLPESNLKNIINRTKSKGNYYYTNANYLLIFPSDFEKSINEGKIFELLVSKELDKLSVKLFNRRVEFSLDRVEKMGKASRGKGIIRQVRNELNTMKNIFEMKEKIAEEDEKKMHEKMQPDPQKIEEVTRKIKTHKVEAKIEMESKMNKEKVKSKIGYGRLESSVEEEFGFLVQSGEDFKFYSEDKDLSKLEITTAKIIPGNYDRSSKKFTPGKKIIVGEDENEIFVPGKMVVTNKGEEFIPGKIVGEKFIPGQYISSTEGEEPKFVPGQTVCTKGQSRFVPGMVLDTKSGPTFIPGQIVHTPEGAKFLPGQVMEDFDGEVKFVPGKIVESTTHGVKFLPSEVIETEMGLHFVANDMTDNETFSLQTFDVDSDELGLHKGELIDSELLSMLNETSVLLNEERPPSVAAPNPNKIQRSISINSFSLFNRVLDSMAQTGSELESIIESEEINEDNVMAIVSRAIESVAGTKGAKGALQAMVLATVADVINRKENFVSPGDIKQEIIMKIKGDLISSCTEEITEDKIAVATAIESEEMKKEEGKAPDKKRLEFKVNQAKTKKIKDETVTPLIENILKDKAILRKVESENSENVISAIAKIINEECENELKRSETESIELIKQAINLAKLMGKHDVAKELESVDVNVVEDPEVLFILRQLFIMKKLAGGDLEKINRILTLPSKFVNVENIEDSELREIVKNSEILTEFVLPVPYFDAMDVDSFDERLEMVELEKKAKEEEEAKEVAVVADEAKEILKELKEIIKNDNEIEHILDDILKTRRKSSCCVILKDNIKAIIPREAAHSILCGEADYTVVDEEGVRYFEAVGKRKLSLKSFSEYSEFYSAEEEVSHSHDVRISEVSTPELDDDPFTDDVKRRKYEEFEYVHSSAESLLDNSSAKHKIAVRPSKRRPLSEKKEVGKGRDAREAALSELIDTEEEFVRDLRFVMDNYYKHLDEQGVPRQLSELRDVIFGNLKQIYEFHSSVLLEGLKYYATEAKMIGRTFLRLERDFDKHVTYCKDEPAAQEFLSQNASVREYFEVHSANLQDEKTLQEHLQLPLQRINDYQVLLRDLVQISQSLHEDTTDLSKALELMVAIPQKLNDLKFLNSIEGFRGNIQKLGRLLKHDWFTVTDSAGKARERYLFLFKARILVTKVRRISDDRSIFILKDILRLPELQIEDLTSKAFALSNSEKYKLESQSEETKAAWLKEIRLYAHDKLALAEHAADDLQLEEVEDRKSEGDDSGETKSVAAAAAAVGLEEKKRQGVTVEEITPGKVRKIEIKREDSVKEEAKVNVKAEESKSKVEGQESVETKKSTESKTTGDKEKSAAALKAQKSIEKPVEAKQADKPAGKSAEKAIDKSAEKVAEKPTDKAPEKPVEKGKGEKEKKEEEKKGGKVETPKEEEYTAPEEKPSLVRRKSSIILRRDSIKMEADKPKFTKPIKPFECEPGDNGKFDCEVESKSVSTVTWMKGNRPLDDKLADRVKITTVGNKHSLEILNCSDNDSGLYTAKSTNENGTSSSSAQLSVHQMTKEERQKKAAENSPHFLVKLKDTELLEDTTVCFMIIARGEPAPKLKFFKNDEPLSTDERVRVNVMNQEKGSYELAIDHCVPEDAGVYKVVANNKFGTDETSGTVTVVNEKVLFAGLEGKHLLQPGEEPEFTWFRDGQAFDPEEKFKVMFQDEEDSLALVFQHVKPEDAGLYTCVASTSSGRISCSAELTVQGAVHQLLREPEAPTILAELTDTEVSVGGSAMLELKVRGFPKPEVTWSRNGEEIQAGGKFRFLYEDDESIALIIKGVQTTDGGEYKVMAKNDMGTAETKGQLLVKAPPKFKKKMQDMACMTEEKFRMEVEVEGNPKPELKWYKDGQLIIASEKIKFTQESDDKFSITIERVTLEDGGNYSVVASNAIGQMSEFWNLVAQMPAKITEKFSSLVECNEKESASLTVKVGGNPTPTLKWYKDNELIKIDGKKYVAENTTLKINNITREDKGIFTCEASNPFGTDKCQGELAVRRGPKITGKISDVAVIAGESAEFTIKADAYPKPKVKWFIGDVEIDGKAYEKSSDGDVHKLKITTVAPANAGKVRAQLENDFGKDECSASLTVKSKPKITTKLQDVRVKENEKLDLKVTIEGVPAPKVQWYHNGTEVNADARIKISKDTTETYHLTFDVVLPSDRGNWSVKAINELGEDSSSAVIIVEGKPVFEKKITEKIEVVETEDLSVEVVIAAEPGAEIRWYLDEKEIKTTDRIKITTIKDTQKSTLVINKITLAESVQLSVVAENKHGSCKSSGNIKVTSLAELKQPKIEALKDVTVKKGEDSAFVVLVRGQREFDIKWTLDGEDVKDVKGITTSDDGENLHMAISKAAAKSGEVVLSVKNSFGESTAKAKLNVLMKPEVSSLKDVTIGPGEKAVFESTVEANPPAKIQWLKGKEQVKADGKTKITSEGNVNRLEIQTDDKSNTAEITLKAVNDQGESQAVAKLNIRRDPPEFVKQLSNVEVKDGESLELQVKVKGSPKPVVEWTKDGNVLSPGDLVQLQVDDNAGVQTLIFSKVSPNECGKYIVKASNNVGETLTTCNLSMKQIPPKFTRPLEKRLSFPEADTIIIKAKVDGSPIPTIQWLKDGKEVVESDRVKFQLQPDGTAVLTISDAKPSDRGNYQVIAKNPNGTTNSACIVDVLATPKKPKLEEPLSGPASLPAGNSLVLKAKIIGHPEPKVRWLKDGKPVRPGVIVSQLPDGTLSLEIENCKESDSGKYTLVATNDHGDLEESLNVTVTPPLSQPKLSEKLKDLRIVEGTPLEQTAVVTGNPQPKISLTKNNAEVKPTLTPKDNQVIVSYTKKAEMSDAGEYVLKAENDLGTIESKGNVQIISRSSDGPLSAPVISGFHDLTVDEGGDLVISGNVKGNPLPFVSVRFGNDSYDCAYDGEKANLKIPNIRMDKGGDYKVVAKNDSGEIEFPFKVNVRKYFQPPRFISKFTDNQQMLSHDAKFGAKISGIPFPTIRWFKDGEELKDSDKYRIKRDGDVISLTVTNCNNSDIGKYSCRLTNDEGQDECFALLQIVDRIIRHERSAAPYFLKEIGDTEVYTGMTAKFTACVNGTPDPDFEWYHNNRKLFNQDRIRFEREGVGLLRLIIHNVTIGDVGEYKIRIFNNSGEAISTAKLSMDTLEDRRKNPVGDQYLGFDRFRESGVPVPLADRPVITRMSENDLTLAWRPSLPIGPRFPVTYTVEMCACPDGPWLPIHKGLRGTNVDIRDLDPCQDYRFRIRVENNSGLSEPSPYVITQRSKLIIAPPTWKPVTVPTIPKDYNLDRPPHEGYLHAPRFLNREHDIQYGVKNHNANVNFYVYGYPKPDVRIQFNGEDLPDYTFTSNGHLYLFINRMSDDRVGVYEAIAKNEHGEARQKVNMQLADFPRFITRPDETYALSRKNVRVIAKVYGIPVPEFKWFKDWQPLGISNRVRSQVIDDEEDPFTVTVILSISDVIIKDQGLYSLTATNIAGSVHHSVMIHVEENENDFNWYTYGSRSEVLLKNRNVNDYYDFGDELGRGTQSICHHVVQRSSGRSYASKGMKGTSSQRLQWMRNEYEIQSSLNHRNLSRLVDAYQTPSGITLINELSSGGELLKYWLRTDSVGEDELRGYVKDILYGLEYMHDRNIGHLGLTPGDLMFSHPNTRIVKISDFGLARRILSKWQPLDYGQPEFVAPEVVLGQGVGLPADMWSLGVIIYLLISGRTPFRGDNDMETLTNIKLPKWDFDESFTGISDDCKDFIHRLMTFDPHARIDVKGALNHSWMKRTVVSDFKIRTDRMSSYYDLLKKWYDNANCRDIYRRRPLSGAFTHPSKMVYPPGHEDTPERAYSPKEYATDSYPRPDLDYEIGLIKSESHYQNGPDTYLLQLRDADFPVRLRQYMKVAASRSPSFALQIKGTTFERNMPVIRERRRFTDVMDEEVDDERKMRISQYGDGPWNSEPRRLRHEVGARLDTHAEADAFIAMKRDGREPFFREKPPLSYNFLPETEVEISVVVDGTPEVTVQWFKNDLVLSDTARMTLTSESLKIRNAKDTDGGQYKVVARNKNGQAISRFRLNYITGETQSEIKQDLDYSIESNPMEKSEEISTGDFQEVGKFKKKDKLLLVEDVSGKEFEVLKSLRHVHIANLAKAFGNFCLLEVGDGEWGDVVTVLSQGDYNENILSTILIQTLDALQYLQWRGLALLNLSPKNILINSIQNPYAKIVDFSACQTVSKIGSRVQLLTPVEFAAPELLNDENGQSQSDIWSIGVVLYILLSGVSPFLGETAEETKQNVTYVRFRFEHLFKEVTQEATRLVMLIFKRSPLKRPSAEELADHRWFLPSDFMSKKRERAVFPGERLKAYLSSH